MPASTSPTDAPAAGTTAAALLDAQVAHHLDRLSEESLPTGLAALADDLFAAAGEHQLADLVDRDELTAIVVNALATVPGSAAVGGFVSLAVQIADEGPRDPHRIGDVVGRDRVEAVVDALLGFTPVLERAMERLTESPLVGTMASRFMGRIVGEVLQANKAVADKVPGLGALMSFGTGAASRVMGAADKQFEKLVGDTVGKSSTFAVRRLNRIVIETLHDPTTREAILQVWDMVAAEQVRGVSDVVTRTDVDALADALHDVAIDTLARERSADLVGQVVDGFFDAFGGFTPTELLDELVLDRDRVVADLGRLAPGVLAPLRESGALERLLRAQLAPFYASPEVAALLD